MPTSESPTLEGTLVALPYPRHDLLERVADEYAALVESHGSKNVLVLKRHPAGLDRLERVLPETTDDPNATQNAVSGPRVESLPEHASKVLETYDPTLERLEYEERIELISLVIAGASRDVPPYLERASEHDSFARDVGRLLLEATRQQIDATGDRDGDAIHPCLAFLYAMNDRFHDELDSRGFVERADVIPRVVDLLEADADGLHERITDSFDAVLAVQFEEFRRLDRRYLAALTGEAELVCVGQRHASVERTRVEPGSLESIADGLEVRPPTRQPESRPPTTRSLEHWRQEGMAGTITASVPMSRTRTNARRTIKPKTSAERTTNERRRTNEKRRTKTSTRPLERTDFERKPLERRCGGSPAKSSRSATDSTGRSTSSRSPSHERNAFPGHDDSFATWAFPRLRSVRPPWRTIPPLANSTPSSKRTVLSSRDTTRPR
ncbi:hypothetical protein ACFQMM_05570 [Saliphagus sp. GCM10025308]